VKDRRCVFSHYRRVATEYECKLQKEEEDGGRDTKFFNSTLINTSSSSGACRIRSRCYEFPPYVDDLSQWRSQKFVMKGVQNRGLVGTGEGGVIEGRVPSIKFSTFWS